jgi:hypothetical protein
MIRATPEERAAARGLPPRPAGASPEMQRLMPWASLTDEDLEDWMARRWTKPTTAGRLRPFAWQGTRVGYIVGQIAEVAPEQAASLRVGLLELLRAARSLAEELRDERARFDELLELYLGEEAP